MASIQFSATRLLIGMWKVATVTSAANLLSTLAAGFTRNQLVALEGQFKP